MKKGNKTQDLNKKTFNHKTDLIIVDNCFLFVLKCTSFLCIKATLYQILALEKTKKNKLKSFCCTKIANIKQTTVPNV